VRRASLLALALVAGCYAADPAGPPRDGAPGLGDAYYPRLGNSGYDVEHYRLELDIDPERGTLFGTARIEARALHGLSSLYLDLWELEVDDVRVGGEAADFERSEGKLHVVPRTPLRGGDPFEVEVVYGGRPSARPDPSVPKGLGGVGWWNHQDEVYVLSEPSGASTVFPANDHLLDKATFEVSVRAPRAWTVASNGTLQRVEQSYRSWEWHFSAREPMATFLFTVAVGRFDVVDEVGPDGLILRHYFPEGSDPEQYTEFAATSEMLAFFEERFGPYPFEAYGGIASNLPVGAALETQTIPVYGAKAVDEQVIAHELAHQWFGNHVTATQWRDIWLHEGFAEYGAWLWGEAQHGRGWLELHVERASIVARRAELGPPAEPLPDDLFGLSTYLRGPLVLHALREEVGDEVFFRILREWSRSHGGGNARIEDFVEIASRVAMRDLGPLLEAWLYADELPARG
jgi:aminopeptidase N